MIWPESSKGSSLEVLDVSSLHTLHKNVGPHRYSLHKIASDQSQPRYVSYSEPMHSARCDQNEEVASDKFQH